LKDSLTITAAAVAGSTITATVAVATPAGTAVAVVVRRGGAGSQALALVAKPNKGCTGYGESGNVPGVFGCDGGVGLLEVDLRLVLEGFGMRFWYVRNRSVVNHLEKSSAEDSPYVSKCAVLLSCWVRDQGVWVIEVEAQMLW
jgi:hypothetical protein